MIMLDLPGATILASTPGKGNPTQPALRSDSVNGLERAIPISDIPYLSSRKCPVSDCQDFNTG